MGKGRIKNFFPGGNTSVGFYSFYKYLPFKTEQVYIIKGGPGTGKSTFMKKIGHELVDEGYDIEFHWCSSDNDSLDGVVIPPLKTAIFDGTAPHMVDPVNPGAVEEIINLGEYWDSDYLKKHRDSITRLNKMISNNFSRVYEFLKAAKVIYDQWKSYYTAALDINKANQKKAQILSRLIKKDGTETIKPSRHLFGSAITPQGPVNYFENLTEDIKNRYLIKGMPGTGKSTLIQSIAADLKLHGYEILHLHCGFIPDKLDGIIVPELDVAILNSTPPHSLEATRDGDRIIDMISCTNTSIISEHEDEINEVSQLFEKILDSSFKFLHKAKIIHDELEEYYVEAMDFEGVEDKRKEIMKNFVKNN